MAQLDNPRRSHYKLTVAKDTRAGFVPHAGEVFKYPCPRCNYAYGNISRDGRYRGSLYIKCPQCNYETPKTTGWERLTRHWITPSDIIRKEKAMGTLTLKEQVVNLVTRFWTFDEDQTPTASYHEKYACIAELEKLFDTTPIMIADAKLNKSKKYFLVTENTLLAGKDHLTNEELKVFEKGVKEFVNMMLPLEKKTETRAVEAFLNYVSNDFSGVVSAGTQFVGGVSGKRKVFHLLRRTIENGHRFQAYCSSCYDQASLVDNPDATCCKDCKKAFDAFVARTLKKEGK